MTFYRGIENFPREKAGGAVVTVGTFDGIHLGHQAILQRVREIRQQRDLHSVLVTFHPHPRVLVSPDNIPMLLTSIEEKRQFIPHFFDGDVLVLTFDEQLKNMEAEQFVTDILIDRIGVRRLVVGYNHCFGHNRSGSIEALRELGAKYDFEVEIVDPVIVDGTAVSSSRIRKLIERDDYAEGLRLLGHDYAIFGTVERGIGLGRKLGYPTANVAYSERKLLPPQGVYSCWAQIGKEEKNGMMFIGRNHFNPNPTVTVEANLFDFDRDIYDEEIVVFPTRFIRENRKFDSEEALVEQIGSDKETILNMMDKGEKQWQ